MAQADGSIILETGVDLDGFAAGSKDLEKAARNTARNIKGISVTTQASLQKQADAIAKINQQYANQKANIEALEQKIKEVGAQKVETEEYKKLNLEIQKTEAALDRAIEKQIKFTETGGKIDSRAFRAMEYDIAQITEKLDEARRKKAQLESSGGAYQGADTSGLTKRLATEEEKLTKIHKRLSESYGNLKTKAALYERKVNDLSSTTSKLHNITRSLTSGMKKMLVSMAGLNKQSKSTELTFGKMLATSLMFSGVYAALSIVMNGLQTGFENLAQYSTETNTSISSLISALTYLKNAFATAFAPILQVVSPLLTAFINMIARAVTYIGMFFAALTGQKTFQKAIPVQEDYAASLRDTANSAKDAADATKEAAKATSDYLSPLDEISRYETSDTIATGGNQASGSLPGYTPPSPEEMFETVPIETSISDFVAKIKALIEAQDWDDLGALLGSKINSITQVVKDAIDWDNVDPHVTYFVTAFTATFNSLVSAINWSLIGQTVGSGINTIVNTLSLLITGIGWKTLGASFALGANGMFNEVDWYALGALLGQKFMIGWNVFHGFVTTLNWSGVGDAIGSGVNGAISEIDAKKMADGMTGFATGLFDSMTEAVGTIDWDAIGVKIGEYMSEVDWTSVAESIGDASSALFQGITDLITSAIATGFDLIDEEDAKLSRSLTTSTNSLRKMGGQAKTTFEDAATAIENITAEQDNVKSLVDEFFELKKKTELTNMEQARLNTLYATLSEKLPGFAEIVGNAETAFDDQRTAVDKLTESLFTHYKVLAMEEKLQDLYSMQYDIEKRLTDQADEYAAAQQILAEAFGDQIYQMTGINSVAREMYLAMNPQIEAAMELVSAYGALETQYNATSAEINGFQLALTDASGTAADYNSALDRMAYKINGMDFTGLSDGIDFVSDMIVTTMNNTEASAGTYISSIEGTLKKFGEEIGIQSDSDWSKIAATIDSYLTDSTITVEERKNKIEELLSSCWYKAETDATSGLQTMNDNVSTGLNDTTQTIREKGSVIVSRFVNICSNAYAAFIEKDWGAIGSNITSGIGTGLDNSKSGLFSKIGGIANGLLNAAKSALGIHSPSRVFRDEVGENVTLGIAEGIQSGEEAAEDAITKISDVLQNGFDFWGIESSLQKLSDLLTAFLEGWAEKQLQLPDVTTDWFIPATYPADLIPALATGTIVPPKALTAYTSLPVEISNIEELADCIALRASNLNESPQDSQRHAEYKFTAQINRRILFEEVIGEAKLRQDKTGENPFDLVRA